MASLTHQLHKFIHEPKQMNCCAFNQWQINPSFRNLQSISWINVRITVMFQEIVSIYSELSTIKFYFNQ